MKLIDDTKIITISLVKEEWNWCMTWLEGFNYSSVERLSEEWFKEVRQWFKYNVSLKYTYDSNIKYDDNISINIPRNVLRIFVFSIGRIAYNFDVKIPTASIGYEIITKIERQLIDDEDWVKTRW